MSALLRKEIRDAVRWLPLGIALLGLLLIYVCQTLQATQLSSQLFTVTWFATLLFGTFLSLVTFLPDERDASRAFLLHRAIEPNQIFRTRVLGGLTVYFLGMFIPLVLLSAYLATNGPERFPVSAWQVVPAFTTVVAGSIFYFAGIVIACRPARWFGTRLFPLVTAAGGSFLSISVLAGGSLLLGLPIYILSCVFALLMVFAARHAFVRMPTQFSPTRARTSSTIMGFILLVSSVLLVSWLGLVPLNFVHVVINKYPNTEFDKAGLPIYVIRSSVWNREGANEVLESIPMIAPSEPRPEQVEISDLGDRFILSNRLELSNPFDPRYVGTIGGRLVYMDPSGYMLVYQQNATYRTMLECVIATDVISLPNEPRGKPFKSIPRLSSEFIPSASFPSNGQSLQPPMIPTRNTAEQVIVFEDGVLKLDLNKRTIECLLKESIQASGFLVTGSMERLAVAGDDSVRIYKSEALEPMQLPSQFALEATLKVQADRGGLLDYRDNNNWTFVDGPSFYLRLGEVSIARSSAGSLSKYNFPIPKETLASLGRAQSEGPFVFGALPPVLTLGSLIALPLSAVFRFFDYVPLLIQWTVAISLTIFVARYRGLNTKQTRLWVVLAVFIGLGIPLAILAIYPVAVYESCNACRRRRRVENQLCEHCGVEWERLPSEGIEIVECELLETLSVG